MIQISNLPLGLFQEEDTLRSMAASILHISVRDIVSLEIVRKSLDARKKNRLHFVYTIQVSAALDEQSLVNRCDHPNVTYTLPYIYTLPPSPPYFATPPVVVGSGPAGLFAALILASCGACPIVIEQGKPVEERAADTESFFATGTLNPFSNIQFGEGGAGTFSDGKLTTGIKDSLIRKVLKEFAEAGAPKEILYEAQPHMGTDNLRTVVKNLRNKIISLGGSFRFNTRLTGLHIQNKTLTGLDLQDTITHEKSQLDCTICVLATGHSARDTYELLFTKGVQMTPKPFSLGVRIEHLQKTINQSQYGALHNHSRLPTASYKLAASSLGGRGAYTFCMCPGGSVVAAASEEGGVVTNGMSLYARDGTNANSALLVGVGVEDFGDDHPLSGMYLQRSIERSAFVHGGGEFKAPAQLAGDFLKDIPSAVLGKVLPTYPRGVALGRIDSCLPRYVTDIMRKALTDMNRQLEGFAAPDALLTACETRSSAPVRILRDKNMQSSLKGLYPCGEGSGYAGGITSSAVDGIRCAEAILNMTKE